VSGFNWQGPGPRSATPSRFQNAELLTLSFGTITRTRCGGRKNFGRLGSLETAAFACRLLYGRARGLPNHPWELSWRDIVPARSRPSCPQARATWCLSCRGRGARSQPGCGFGRQRDNDFRLYIVCRMFGPKARHWHRVLPTGSFFGHFRISGSWL